MRRRNRFILKGSAWGAGIMAFVDILSQSVEHNNRGEKFTWESYNGWRTVKRVAVGVVAGGGIGYGVYRYKLSEEKKLPFNSDSYVRKLLAKEHLKANPILFKKVLVHREKIKLFLEHKFGNKLVAKPQDAGSFYKRTAIASNYDLDIVLPFEKNSYITLEDMYNDVYETVEHAFGPNAKVTKQTKGIGITFEENGNPIHFDIVPGREIKNYIKEKDLNLFVRPDWIWQKGSSSKTNLNLHRTITTNKPEARTVIKLLKAYRDRNNLPLPALMIDQCVVEALSENNFGVHTSSTENLLNSMSFLSKKLEQRSLMDIANSNNNLQNKLSEVQRRDVSNQLREDIERIEKDPRYIQEIFPS